MLIQIQKNIHQTLVRHQSGSGAILPKFVFIASRSYISYLHLARNQLFRKLHNFHNVPNTTMSPTCTFVNHLYRCLTDFLKATPAVRTPRDSASRFARFRLRMRRAQQENYQRMHALLKYVQIRIRLEVDHLKMRRSRLGGITMSASAFGLTFSWDEGRISDSELRGEVKEILKTLSTKQSNGDGDKFHIDFEASRQLRNDDESEWIKIYDKPDLVIWRRPVTVKTDEGDEYELFEYKCLGRVHDLTALEYFQTQLNLEFRKEWDYLALFLRIIDRDTLSSTELIRWVMKFPYPLHPREYMYVRRFCLEPNERLLILVSRSLPECDLPANIAARYNADEDGSESVRVTKYKSHIIISPHRHFDEPGFEYIIQYYDDSKARIPKIAYKWMAASGLPDYVQKVHDATIMLKRNHPNLNDMDVLKKFETFYVDETKRPADLPLPSLAEPPTNSCSNALTARNEFATTDTETISNTENTLFYQLLLHFIERMKKKKEYITERLKKISDEVKGRNE